MSSKPVSVATIPYGDYVVASTTAQGTAYDGMCSTKCEFPDADLIAGSITTNGPTVRQCVWVKNGSGGTLAAGDALNWVSGQWGKQVQDCPAGSPIRCYVPSYVRGSTSNTIPNNAYFYAIFEGYTSPNSDGSAIAVNDGLVVGGTSGQVRTDYGLGGGEVYASVAASTVLTNTVTATKYDQNYTFPAKSLNAGDTIRVTGQISIPAGNSTNTLATDLMLGTQVIDTLAAFDPTDAGGDIISVIADIEIRTAGASGTMVANVTWFKNVNGTTTVIEHQLTSTAIDTTAAQQLALRGTWSVANASNQSRQDILNISRLNTTGIGLKSGLAIATAAGGSSVQFRAKVNCQW